MNSFFGTDAQKSKFANSGGPVVVRKVVKKSAPPKPVQPSSSTPRSGQGSSSTPSSTRPGHSHSSNGSNGHRTPQLSSSKGKEKQSGFSSSSKSKPRELANSSSRSPPSSKLACTPSRKVQQKRKVEQDRIESESSGSEDAVDLLGSGSNKNKRSRLNGNGNGNATGSSTPMPGMGEERIGRDRTLFKVETEGQKGWEGFVSGDEIVRGVRRAWDGKGEEEGKGRSMLDKYVACELDYTHTGVS
jgi:hypothetical protein